MTTVLVLDPIPELAPYQLEQETAAAFGATFVLGDGTLRDAEVILNTGAMALPATALRELRRCRLIVRYGTGYDTIDVAEATRLGIMVANAPSYGVAEVADHACALILALARRIPWLDREVRAGRWFEAHAEAPQVRRLSALTLGVIGLGRIGRAVARRMAAFEMRILGVDPQYSDEAIRALGIEPHPLDDVLRAADIVTLHVPLTPATQGLIGRRELALLRPTAMIVNTGRGGLIDETALAEALATGRLAGAALDVLSGEPPDPAHPLLQIDPRQVILTPHFGSASADARAALHREVAAALEAFLGGQAPVSLVNPNVASEMQVRRKEEAC